MNSKKAKYSIVVILSLVLLSAIIYRIHSNRQKINTNKTSITYYNEDRLETETIPLTKEASQATSHKTVKPINEETQSDYPLSRTILN